MGEEVVAVAFKVVTDEFRIVAVGDKADSLGEKRLVGLDFLQTDRSLLAGDLRDPRQLIDKVAPTTYSW